MLLISTTFSIHNVKNVVDNLFMQSDLNVSNHVLLAYYFLVNILFFLFLRERERGSEDTKIKKGNSAFCKKGSISYPRPPLSETNMDVSFCCLYTKWGKMFMR